MGVVETEDQEPLSSRVASSVHFHQPPARSPRASTERPEQHSTAAEPSTTPLRAFVGKPLASGEPRVHTTPTLSTIESTPVWVSIFPLGDSAAGATTHPMGVVETEDQAPLSSRVASSVHFQQPPARSPRALTERPE